MILVAVVVYDRFQNIEEWVRVWHLSQTEDAELVIIHNYRNESERHAYKTFCDIQRIHYIPRKNIGFDIGAFQDVCLGRLEGFNFDFTHLLWCTDDILPMRHSFLVEFEAVMLRPGVIAACYEVSKEVHPHIRTTGFMLAKETLGKIKFNVDPITTKNECYEFEHRDKFNSLIDQVQKWGAVVQVADVEDSPLWDSGHNSKPAIERKRRREKERRGVFSIPPVNGSQKVIFICPIYETYPEIISSLINQSHKNWELHLIHDGPCKSFDMRAIVEAAQDFRIKYTELPERLGNFGHHIRHDMLKKLTYGDFVVITNGDNFHTPNFTEVMLGGFTDRNVIATYCGHMVHSYIAWGVIECRMEQGYVDCAGVMIRRHAACSVGWNDIEAHSADWFYFADIIAKYGIHKFKRVEGCLLTHN